MITRKQRMVYAISTGIPFIIGMLLYGYVTYSLNFPPVILFSLLGGIFFGGMPSGCVLFSRFLKKHSSRKLRIISSIFFPFTILAVMLIGICSFIPYYVCSLVILIRTKHCDDPIDVDVITNKSAHITWIVTLSLIVCICIGGFVYTSFQEASISQDIFAQTGYAAGTPDHEIIRAFFFTGKTIEPNSEFDYQYCIENRFLFASADNNGVVSSKIIFPGMNGMYSISNSIAGLTRYVELSGDKMRADIDVLFTNIHVGQYGNSYAYMLALDTRSDKEYIAEYLNRFSSLSAEQMKAMDTPELEKYILGNIDKSYADPGKLQLYDENGNPIQCLTVDHGRYKVYCGSFSSGNTRYKIAASYQGKESTLLTYDDIVHFNIYSSIK